LLSWMRDLLCVEVLEVELPSPLFKLSVMSNRPDFE